MRVEVDAVWAGDRFRGRTVYEVAGPVLRRVDEPREPEDEGTASGIARLGGTLIPHLTDHHTHLGLTDQPALFRAGITDAVDLGWVPEVASTWLADDADRPAVAIAGALLTAVGGYPLNAGWGPAGSCAELHDTTDAVHAVRAQLAAGASRIKATLNTVAGPTIDQETLRAVVAEAHASGVPVTVHVEGIGQAERAIAAGADQLAHAPFTERLDDDLLQRAADAGMTWVSTLDIHGWGRPTRAFRVAQENIRRFVAAGGRILYGTDLGNGALPVGVNARELAALADAGLDATSLLQSIAGVDDPDAVGPRFAWLPAAPPANPPDTPPDAPPDAPDLLPAWLATARGRTVRDSFATLQEDS